MSYHHYFNETSLTAKPSDVRNNEGKINSNTGNGYIYIKHLLHTCIHNSKFIHTFTKCIYIYTHVYVHYIHSGNDCKSTVCLSVRYTDAVRFEDAELLLLFDSASRAEEWKMVR